MDFRTIVDIEKPKWQIEPAERILFVGSCFADRIGQRFAEEHFPVTVNPYGVMYNPASILHTVERVKNDECEEGNYDVAVLTLGTNHIYIEKATGEIVDNCQKRPQSLFEERELTIAECADCLRRVITRLHQWNPKMKIMLTVSPIRYQKYGFHRSQLSKSTLLLAIEEVLRDSSLHSRASLADPSPFTLHSSLYYFPAYEIVNDELRDYRFYNSDMLHPTDQTVEYIWQRLVETCFSDPARQYLEEWHPLKKALAHRPLNPESADYQLFLQKTQEQLKVFEAKWGF